MEIILFNKNSYAKNIKGLIIMKIMILFISVLVATISISFGLTYLFWKGTKHLASNKFNNADIKNWSKRRKSILGIIVTFTFFCLLFFTIVSPIYDTYGTTEEDAQIEFPDEDFLANPKMFTFHAIDIDAAPEEIWKWIVQVGGSRAGWYSYDWAENFFGYGIYNSYDIREEWQSMDVGQILFYNRDGDCGFISHVEPNKYFTNRWDYRMNQYDLGTGYYAATGETVKLRSTVMMPEFLGDPKFKLSWTLYIKDYGNGKSRLLSRAHLDWDSNIINNTIMSSTVPIMHAMMDLQMLHEIKDCAEGRASDYKPTKLPEGINPKPSDYKTYSLPEDVRLFDL